MHRREGRARTEREKERVWRLAFLEAEERWADLERQASLSLGDECRLRLRCSR